MKKLLGVIALLIAATLLLGGFENYSQREDRAKLAQMRERVQTDSAMLAARHASIIEMQLKLVQHEEALERDSLALTSFESKYPAGISDYKVFSTYKKRIAEWNASAESYNVMYAKWDSLDQSYAADLRRFNQMRDSTNAIAVTLDATPQLLPRFASLKRAFARR